MLAYTKTIVKSADALAAVGSANDVLAKLRELALGDFGELMWSLPNPEYANLSAILPTMADAQVQLSWTGMQGAQLLVQTYDFVSRVDYHYKNIAKGDIKKSSILDFGCGYGRLFRFMYYFTDPENIWGVDPWDESIRICNDNRLLGNYLISDYLPENLPVGDRVFDLIYAFSVFTHTSERVTKLALKTLRDYVAPTGLCAITIRPREFWSRDPGYKPAAAVFERTHDVTGFAFAPHQRAPVDGDITYGDTSMTFDWIERHAPGWEIAGHDRSLNDPYQIVVFLRPI
jgi:SAM-dependent methyltransferase